MLFWRILAPYFSFRHCPDHSKAQPRVVRRRGWLHIFFTTYCTTKVNVVVPVMGLLPPVVAFTVML